MSCCLENLSMNFCHIHHDLGGYEVLNRRWVYDFKQGVRSIMQIIHRQESINDVDLLRLFLLRNYLVLMTLQSLSRLTVLRVTGLFNHIVRSLGWKFICTHL